jgi:outer membrane protein TolC
MTRAAFTIRVLVIGVLSLPFIKLSAETVTLDLAEAFQRAQYANFDVLLAAESRETAVQNIVRSRSNLLPSLTLEADQSRSMNPIVGGFTQGGAPATVDRTFVNRFDAVIRARMSVLDLNRRADYQVSRYNLRIAENRIESIIQDIYALIANSYFAHLRNIQRLDVIDANMERDEVLLRIARNQLEGGVATPLDVTRAEVSLATNELARLSQETMVLESGLQIKRILSLPLGAELELQRVAIPENSPLDFSIDQALPGVFERRADFRQEAESLERNQYARRAANWQRLPSVEVSGMWGGASQTIGDDLEEQWRVAVGVSVPLFDGFRIRANKLEADSAIRSQEYVVRQLQQQIESDLRLAAQDLKSRYSQVQVARKSVALNQREYELARIRFEEGVADNADVVNAMARLAEAEGVLVDARFAYHLSSVRLARVRGDMLEVLR